MNTNLNDSGIFTPCGDELALLLNQPEISGAFIRNILKERGMLVSSLDKAILNEHLILSFLSPSELDALLNEIKSKEETLKLRTTIHEVTTADVSLSAIVPRQSDIKFNESCKDPHGNYIIEGNPSFKKINDETYLLDYSLIRNHITANWIKSHPKFTGRIELKKKLGSNKLVIEGYHSSQETKDINSIFKTLLKRHFTNQNVIKEDSERSLTFGDFTNAERLSFFMKFTKSFPLENFSFSKVTDLDFKVDDKLVPSEELRIAWMKDQISKSKISGKSLQESFLLKERDCWNYIKVWKFEMKFDISTLDFNGDFNLILEFDGYARQFANSAKFQMSIDKINTRRFKGSTQKLQRTLLEKLNSLATTFAENILNGDHTPAKA